MRARETLGDTPWQLSELISVLGRLAVALAVIVASWFGASGTVRWEDQLLWTTLSIGIGGVVFGLSSVALWLLAGFRGVRYELQAVLTPLRDLTGKSMTLSPPPPSAYRTVTSRGMSHYHRGDCLLVAGKASTAINPDDVKLLPCGVCTP